MLTYYNSNTGDHLFSLEKNGEVLEIFIESVSRYVTWWTRMHMSMSQQADSSEELSKMYSAVRKGNVKRKWKKLATDFQEYADKVSRLHFGFISSQTQNWGHTLSRYYLTDAPPSRRKSRRVCAMDEDCLFINHQSPLIRGQLLSSVYIICHILFFNNLDLREVIFRPNSLRGDNIVSNYR